MIRQCATTIVFSLFACLISCPLAAADRFRAVGPSSPEKMQPHQEAVVTVSFDLLPTSMSFHAPAYPCHVSENGIQYSNGFAETYDPRLDPDAAETSFETAFDDDNLYARMWIESQHDARIVVRVRGALVCDEGKRIAHSDIPSDSPHGQGDWVDEWYYIYPDGVHARHVRVYTGLASRSLPFGFNREPPRVIHEFMEAMVLGKTCRRPEDDIEAAAVTLIKTVRNHSEDVIPDGESKMFSFDPYLPDFADFRHANIMIVNLKSRYRPFTIAMPYGLQTQPYRRSDRAAGFQVWGDDPNQPYTVALGHMINYSHLQRTEKTLDQAYLSGWIDRDEDSRKTLAPLAWSWVAPPKVSMQREEPSYAQEFYDPKQKAYVFDWAPGSDELSFDLIADLDYYGVLSTIVNPVFVVKGWGQATPALEIDDRPEQPGRDFRYGYETAENRTNLVLWLDRKSDEPANIAVRPRDP